MKKTVTIQDDVVIKTDDPELLRIKVAKTIRAREIGMACGLFSVPRVLDYDETAGKATFELIGSARKLREALLSEKTAGPLMNMAGQSLALIHRDLHLPDNLRIPLPPAYRLPGSEVFFHGDFALGNIGVDPAGRRLVIFDWQTPRKLGATATYGSHYFDVLCFVYALFYRPIGRRQYHIAAPAGPTARVFLDSYIEAAAFGFDGEVFTGAFRIFMNAQSAAGRRWRWKRRLRVLPSHIRLRRFMNSYTGEGGSNIHTGVSQ